MLLVKLLAHVRTVEDSVTAEVNGNRPLRQDVLDALLGALTLRDLNLHILALDRVLNLCPLLVVLQHGEERELVVVLEGL